MEMECNMRFDLSLGSKQLIFDSDLHGLRLHGVETLSGRDGILIYDKTRDLPQTDLVELQMSTNTSTLIPSIHWPTAIESLPHLPYHEPSHSPNPTPPGMSVQA